MGKAIKKPYASPRVLREASLVSEGGILTTSIVNNTTVVETAGQENAGFYDYGASGSTFNHTWGE